ncbi:DmpA family aminopeptidase [Verminephrobacter eiseniae]|uniref:DmpA family aminopeptidase n=1 Tax=Verminephrobacter eiseniae TaxID=364317 RepID=UPI002239079D|nr:P1 family peptidase [Verminephrobacter eiseniae]MCW5238778.1 S58 family peptidase [Verminephrobacter eiseniae]
MASTTSLPFIGTLPAGTRDAITDVAGVTVGHRTLADGPVQTGVTVVRPHAGDPFRDKVPAAAVVLNGFGKSVGLVQLAELGVLETPIALTNTFSVGTVATAQIRECAAANPETGRALPTVNPLVFECNDGFLNDIQRLAVTEADYLQALAATDADFAQGSVGAGRGMSSFQLKGGIGSASRRVAMADGTTYTVGALVLANYGRQPQLVLAGHAVGEKLAALQQASKEASEPEKGSIIIVVATDAPLDARQLRRLALRAGAGLARTGSVFGHGSGDLVLAFSTAYTVPDRADRPTPAVAMLHDTLLDGLFQAAADSTEQAIFHALWRATPVTGRDGNHRAALGELLPVSFLSPLV